MLTRINRLLMRIFLCGEVVIFCYVCFYGSHGLYKLAELKQENVDCLKKVDVLAQEVAQLKNKIFTWQQYAHFYKEKIAREQLRMAYKNDSVYYITKEAS